MDNRHHPTRRGMWTWRATLSVFGLTGGILAALFGSLLTASTWLLGVGLHPWLHEFGSILLLLTIPLLLFGGLCFDSMDKRERRLRAGGREDGAPKKVERGGARAAASVAALLVILCGGGNAAHAQQTIFNVPSTDVLNRGQVYGELDASLKPNNSSESLDSATGHRNVIALAQAMLAKL